MARDSLVDDVPHIAQATHHNAQPRIHNSALSPSVVMVMMYHVSQCLSHHYECWKGQRILVDLSFYFSP